MLRQRTKQAVQAEVVSRGDLRRHLHFGLSGGRIRTTASVKLRRNGEKEAVKVVRAEGPTGQHLTSSMSYRKQHPEAAQYPETVVANQDPDPEAVIANLNPEYSV